MSEVIAVLFMVLVLPLAIVMHYMTKWKATKGLSAEDERMLEDLWENAERMQSRINALETILDSQAPQWRKRV
jgi:phage shock protein B